MDAGKIIISENCILYAPNDGGIGPFQTILTYPFKNLFNDTLMSESGEKRTQSLGNIALCGLNEELILEESSNPKGICSCA